MPNPHPNPPLKPLHPNASLSLAKLAQLEQLSTDALKHSLIPGQRDCLKTRPDGTILDGHHRIHILRKRGVDVDKPSARSRHKEEFLSMWTELHWVDGPWPGKLALASRPRGGDWLEDEMASWRRAGIDTVLSLLTREEEHDLDLTGEAREAKARGMEFVSLPIPDRQVPGSEAAIAAALEKLDADLSSGKNVAVHCRQGIGRTGLVAGCLLVSKGWNPETAVKILSAARGAPVPETTEQRRWIDRYAAILSAAK
jgi:protein-tyrosine phosphatase